ncbi:MAG: hypothetical protein ACI97X_001808, partial [Oceanospirillaceae bacterium]
TLISMVTLTSFNQAIQIKKTMSFSHGIRITIGSISG